MKNRIEMCVNILFRVLESLCKIVLLFMVCVVTAQVIVRVFGGNIKWCEETMLILLDALMFLLMPVGIKEDLHIRIDLVARHFSKKGRVAVVYFSNIVLLIISVSMVYYGNILAQKTNTSFTITGFPRKYLYLITVLSGILCTLVVVLKMFGMLKTEATENYLNGTNAGGENQ